jgi:hypothetical protein
MPELNSAIVAIPFGDVLRPENTEGPIDEVMRQETGIKTQQSGGCRRPRNGSPLDEFLPRHAAAAADRWSAGGVCRMIFQWVSLPGYSRMHNVGRSLS